MINTILSAFDLQLVTQCQQSKEKTKIKCLKKKIKRIQDRNRVLTDIAIGIKREDLKSIYKRVSSVKALIEEFTAQRNIFI